MQLHHGVRQLTCFVPTVNTQSLGECMGRTSLTSGECGCRRCVDALPQAIANVVMRLGHQSRVAQVGAVEGEDGRWEQAAIPCLHTEN